jgi:hypothetical protein
MIKYEDLPYLTQGKSVAEIQLMYETLDDARIIFRESCKNKLIEFLNKENATEEHPFRLDLELESDKECFMPGIGKTVLTALWVDNNDVWGEFDFGTYMLEALDDYELLQIIDKLE